MTNSCNCPTGSYGQKHTAECYEDRLTQLRGNLSLAEEGLASATQEIERLKAEIRALDQANGQAVRENERLRAASALLVNAVEDTLRSHPEELSCCTVTRIRCAAMREMLADPWEAKMLGKALIPLAPSHEPGAPHPAVALLKEADYWLDELRHKGYVVGELQDRIHAITAPEDDSHNGVLVKRGAPWPPAEKSKPERSDLERRIGDTLVAVMMEDHEPMDAEKSNQDGRQAPAPSGNAGLGTAGGASSLHQSSEKSGGGQ